MSDDLVKRARHNALADMPHYASVELIEAMAARIEELEDTLSLRTNLHGESTYVISDLEAKLAAKEKLMLALAGDKIDLVSELAGVKEKLVKAVKLAEEAFDFNIEDAGPRAWHSINDRIEELKGQDDE
jgi:uncharacterized protein (UPF0276 family)